ncbi:sialate O-acetylesterase [Granulosicoccus sp. 3-233]|uniref:sialate O-acetylesterase n=1 Tax=Granulosicoccus sp. 3-233 TaxID=3417969 RepID=UPI003D325EAA
MRTALVVFPALLLACLLPVAALADDEPPGLPDSLSSARYSATAGEIFWTPASDNVFVTGYHVVRDGESLGIRDARSVFEPTLIPDQSYTYQVSAVDRAGNEGPAMQVDISARSGVGLEGQPADDDGGGSTAGTDGGSDSGTGAGNGTDGGSDGATDGGTGGETDGSTDGGSDTSGGDSGGSDDDDGLKLYLDRSRVTLVEGDSQGVSIAIKLNRIKRDKRPVSLSLETSDRDRLGLRHTFSPAELSPQQTDSVLNLQLDVTAAPLLLHERFFQIVADDGVSITRIALIVDVTPTAAPDVYLLVGQSNMEGYSEEGSREQYPGGRDERNERILQLNVQPNNRRLFPDDASFSDEKSNILEPMFVPAEDPLHEPRYIQVDGKGATFVGLGLTFAKQALRMTTADIYLVPSAWGATGFCANANGNLAWNAAPTSETFLGGSLLTNRALTRLNMTLRESGGVLRGILWHQGGADSNNPDCARTYAQNLQTLVHRLRREARQDARGPAARGNGAEIPLIVATQSKGDDERGNFSIYNPSKQLVDAAHRTVSDYIPHSTFVNNDDLVPPQYPCGQVSCVHFGAAALREQGRRFHAALKGLWSALDTYHY